jgi:hypothetical protein
LLIGQADNIDILRRSLPAMEEVYKDLEVTARSVGLQVIQERNKMMKQSRTRQQILLQNGVNLMKWRNLNILDLY